MMEASLSKVGLVSIQSDIMQVNKGTKELALEMESLRQKMVVHDDLLQLMNKGQEDIKSSFDRGLKVSSVKISEKILQKSSMAIPSPLSDLPQKIETSILKLQKDLLKTFTKEIQAVCSRLEVPKRKRDTPAINDLETSQKMHSVKSMQRQSNVHHATLFPKIETGGWKSVKHEEAASNDIKPSCNPNGVSSFQLGRKCKIMVDSDEDINGAFLSLFKETETGNSSIEEAREETERILRKARRRKRKHSNTIFLD